MIKVEMVRPGAQPASWSALIASQDARQVRGAPPKLDRARVCELPLSSETGHTGRFSKRTRWRL